MKSNVHAVLDTIAHTVHVGTDRSYHDQLDSYVGRAAQGGSDSDISKIQLVLGAHALDIARADGKTVAQSDDVKAAIWLYHRPKDLDDTCNSAAVRITSEWKSGVGPMREALANTLAGLETSRSAVRQFPSALATNPFRTLLKKLDD